MSNDTVTVRVEHTCLDENESKECPACMLTKSLEEDNVK